jgi:tRNA-dihydrouridine synthase B
MLALYGTTAGVGIARKHLGWYTKGLPGSAEFRNRVNQLAEPAAVLALLDRFFAGLLERGATALPLAA